MKRISIKEKIRGYFFVNPTAKLRVRGIERELNIPLPSTIKYCKELEKESILKTIKTGNVIFYSADRSSEKFLMEKKFFNIKKLHEKGLLKYIKTELHNPIIILFGSYGKGEDIENSDIDLYIQTPSKKGIQISGFEKLLERKIQIFRFSDIKEVGNPNLANNIINGIVLNGFIEVFK